MLEFNQLENYTLETTHNRIYRLQGDWERGGDNTDEWVDGGGGVGGRMWDIKVNLRMLKGC